MTHLLPAAFIVSAALTGTDPSGSMLEVDRSRLHQADYRHQLDQQIHRLVSRACRAENRYGAHVPRAHRVCMRATVEQVWQTIELKPEAHFLPRSNRVNSRLTTERPAGR